LLKTREMAQFLNGKKRRIDFTTPAYTIYRHGANEIRRTGDINLNARFMKELANKLV